MTSYGICLSLSHILPLVCEYDHLSMIISRSIHVAANGIISFLWLIFHYTHTHTHTHTHIFIHSSVDGYLGCFNVLATVNSVTMNIGVRVPF